MKIVVLDGVPLNPGDLDWSPLGQLGDLEVFERTRPEEVLSRLAEAEVVFTNKVKLPREAIAGAPRLKLISVLATGYDVVDIEAARERGITVCNVPAYSSHFTAQTAWALILELAMRSGAHSDAVRGGAWSSCVDFSFWNFPLTQLEDKVLLIVGMGRIGQRVAKIGEAFGMKVLAAQLPGREAKAGHVPLDEALPQADVVSLHCPLTPQTRNLMNAERLGQMKSGALLVNTARGPLVDEVAVVQALQDGRLAGYAADVLSVEPPPADNPLLGAPNCIITPHLGWASRESRQRLLNASVENLCQFLRGEPQNVVS